MGVLTEATPLPWEDSLDKLAYVREHGVIQFLHNYENSKEFSRDQLLYGDELEYGIFKLDHEKKSVQLSLRSASIMKELKQKEKEVEGDLSAGNRHCAWVPEYGSWMIEATPSVPYGGFTTDLRAIECNMRTRRARLTQALAENEIAPTVVTFPLMGVGAFAGEEHMPNGPVARSLFVPDAVINPHPRFGTLTANIRKRRGRNVEIHVPLFQDMHTDMSPEEGSPGGKPGIYMDAMAFGMGCCCLQITFQARDLGESRHLYDQLAVMAPIMLALTAGTPIHKGKLADWDARWNIISGSVDCRTQAESGEPVTDESVYHEGMAGGGRTRLHKSRYSGIDCYICNHKDGLDPHASSDHYNDIEVQTDKALQKKITDTGLDELMAQHVAHLFVRDPLVIFKEHVEIDDANRTDHFENIQSTNWNSVRWKPPPAHKQGQPHIGWRTEFRSMEVQLTDYENAAFSAFIVLLSRVLLSFDLNLYIPISQVDANMERAHKRDAVTEEKFFFRSHLAVPDDSDCKMKAGSGGKCAVHDDADRVEEMTLTEILNGKGSYFPGLIPLIKIYIESIGIDAETESKVQGYLDLITKRASGELLTTAAWMRKFVRTHGDYKGDSIVSQRIAYDLMVACNDIGLGERPAPELLGSVQITPIATMNAYNVQLSRIDFGGRKGVNKILERYRHRAELTKRRHVVTDAIKKTEKDLASLKTELREIDEEFQQTQHIGIERMRLDSDTIHVNHTTDANRTGSK